MVFPTGLAEIENTRGAMPIGGVRPAISLDINHYT